MNQKNYMITKDMIVNDVVNNYPQTNEIFTKYGVDTCCGGVQSIEKTVVACNVNLDEVLKTLNDVVPTIEKDVAGDKSVNDDVEVTDEDIVETENGGEITRNTTVKEIIMHNPETKGVFSKYGLLECGGEYGPEEAIYFFARVHNVDPDGLIKELNDVIRGKLTPPETSADDAASAYENIYEKFIKTAIVIALSTGCVYGALILFYMGIQHSLYSVPKVLIETHGHTQIYGWCGLFIMGVSYFVLPRFYAVCIYSAKLANLSFYFMVAGIFLVFTYRTFLPLNDHFFFKALILSGCFLEVVAVLMFLIVAVKTVLSAEKQELETYETYLFSGYLWFLIATVAHAGIALYMITTNSTVFTHAAIYSLRHIQVMGFITLVIFGVLSRTLPAFLGLKTPNAKVNLLIMFMLNASVLVRAVSQPLMVYYADFDLPFYYVFNTLYFTSGCVEFLSVLLFLYNLNILSKPEVDFSGMEIEKSYEKFVWAGILWLIVGEIAMMVFTVQESFTGVPVSHALIGAYRHAVTVGFITMMIFGFASRIIPISQGVKLHSYSSLTMTFILINAGSAIRVVFQPLAVHTGSVPSYLIMGISGLIESVAILLFGINIWRTLSDGKRQGAGEEDDHSNITSVTASTNVHHLIKQHPPAMDILISKGFTQLKNPILRNTMTRAVNLGQATKMHNTDLDQLLKELNESLKS
tara:strand:- start:1371 stop:3452 length:2082 start_codon:yes stop_codon:yes gene_type:complete